MFDGVPAEPSPDETVGPLLATSFLGGLSGKLDTAKAGHFIPASDGRQDAPSGEVVVATGKGGGRNIDVSPTLDTQGSQPDRNQMGVAIVDPSPPPEVVAAVTAKWAKGSGGPAGDETQNLVLAFHPTQAPISSADVSHALSCGSKSGQASVAVVTPDHAENGPPVAVARHVTEVVPTLRASDGTLRPDASADAVIIENLTARRLTPRECERLQGMPDDHTLVPFGRRRKPKDIEELAVYWGVPADIARTLAADCHRYKAVGNGMAVPVVWWIGRRIEWVLQQLAAWDGLFDDDFLPLGDRS